MSDIDTVYQENRALEEEIERLRRQYRELIFAVSKKYPGESRHETALRYIKKQDAGVQSGPSQEAEDE